MVLWTSQECLPLQQGSIPSSSGGVHDLLYDMIIACPDDLASSFSSGSEQAILSGRAANDTLVI